MEYVGNVLYDEELLKGIHKYVIFGAGIYGRNLFDYLCRNGLMLNIVGFCDSDKSLNGTKIGDVVIYTVDGACSRYPDAIYLISGKYAEEMYQILKKKRIERVHILFV